jgi:hypothetical protein
MECASEFQELASHNPFIQDLEEQGYHLDFVNAYFVIYGLPCLNSAGELEYGDWASPVDLNGWIIDAPSDHQAWFKGCRPHDQNGRALRLGGGAATVQVADVLCAIIPSRSNCSSLVLCAPIVRLKKRCEPTSM